jgi:hypothetical protein
MTPHHCHGVQESEVVKAGHQLQMLATHAWLLVAAIILRLK